MNWLMHLPALCIAIPLFFAFLTPLVEKFFGKARNIVVFIGILAAVLVVLLLSFNVFQTGTAVYTMGSSEPGLTLPSGMALPVRIIFEIDAFSAMMAGMAGIVSLLAIIYSFKFLKEKELGKFYSLAFVMFAGLIGLLFTGDLFTMFVFFEVLSISSVALIAFWKHKKEAPEAAFKYLLVSSVASLFLLFSIGLLYGQYGVLNLAGLAVSLKFGFIDVVALGLLVTAFAMKAGSAPMHFWLPDAYGAAPTPITVMLGASTLASLYALIRILFSVFGAFPLMNIVAWLLIVLGIVSMFVGVTMALKQDDIKRLIAFTAVSQTGFILMAIGASLAMANTSLGVTYGVNALKGGLFHLLNHGLYEALLFMSAGAIVFATGKRKLSELSGLARTMPYTTIFFLLGACAIAGIPPLNGFASKILIYESVYAFNPLLTVLALVASVLTLVPFVKAFSSAFLGPELAELKKTREVPFSMLFGMFVLAVIILFIGLFPEVIVELIVEPAAMALASQTQYIGGIM